MSQITRITLVRHGETEWNISGRWQGHLDAPLTVHGQAQAKALGERFKEKTFDACYTSDLGRAVRTSDLVGGPSSLHLQLMEKLKPKLWGNASKEEPSMPVTRVTWVEPSTLQN